MTEFDYLVIGGGGTAGCIVAARLAEDPAVSVGLAEWGPSDEAEPRARSIRRWAEIWKASTTSAIIQCPSRHSSHSSTGASAPVEPPRCDIDAVITATMSH